MATGNIFPHQPGPQESAWRHSGAHLVGARVWALPPMRLAAAVTFATLTGVAMAVVVVYASRRAIPLKYLLPGLLLLTACGTSLHQAPVEDRNLQAIKPVMPPAPTTWQALTVWPTLTETVDMCADRDEVPSGYRMAT